MTYVRIGLRRSGKLLLRNDLMLSAKDRLALQALLFPLLQRLLLVRGLLRKSRTRRLPLLLPPFLQKGRIRGGGGGSRDAPCAASHGASSPPARRVSSERGGSASGRSSVASERASVSSAPSRAEDPGVARSRRSPVARSAPSFPRAFPVHHCTLCEVMSRESLRRPAPVLDPPALPGLLAEKDGRIVEPAPGWLALAPLPIHGLAVESVVDGSRRYLFPPVNGLGVTSRGLRTATGLAAFAPVRGPAVTSRCLLTATGLVGIALTVTGLGLLTATGLGASVRVPMVDRGLVVTGLGYAVPIADPVTGPFFPLTTRGHGEEAGEPDVSCRSVWRLLLSPRLPLPLKRRQQWLLL